MRNRLLLLVHWIFYEANKFIVNLLDHILNLVYIDELILIHLLLDFVLD